VVDSQWVRVHVRVNATQVLRAVDLGPSADDADAVKAFRTFWGEKSELRRFPVRLLACVKRLYSSLRFVDANWCCRMAKLQRQSSGTSPLVRGTSFWIS